MKTKTSTALSLAFALALTGLVALSGCKQPDNNDNTPKTQYATLLLHLHTDIDTSEADADTAIRNSDGRLLSLHSARVYISNVRAIKTDGSEVAVKDTVILKTIDEEEYTIGQIPAGNYKSVKFDVGVDSPANHTDPTSYFSRQALSPKSPPMWFGNTGKGYMFVNVNGMIDSSDAKNGTANYPFSFQIGSDALLKTVTMPDKNYSVLPQTPYTIHITIDYGKLFNGLNVKKQNMNATFDDPATAQTIANNIPSMFNYEQ